MTLEVRLNRTIWETRIGGSNANAVFDRFIQSLESLNSSPEGIEEGITITVINDNLILDDKVNIVPIYSSAIEDFNGSMSGNWGLYFTKVFTDFNIKPLN
jgi:hypothetical protein